jgi:hypothetical protein
MTYNSNTPIHCILFVSAELNCFLGYVAPTDDLMRDSGKIKYSSVKLELLPLIWVFPRSLVSITAIYFIERKVPEINNKWCG